MALSHELREQNKNISATQFCNHVVQLSWKVYSRKSASAREQLNIHFSGNDIFEAIRNLGCLQKVKQNKNIQMQRTERTLL